MRGNLLPSSTQSRRNPGRRGWADEWTIPRLVQALELRSGGQRGRCYGRERDRGERGTG